MKLEDYLKLPYTFVSKKIKDETGEYYAGYIEEFYEAKTVGDTIEELYSNLRECLILGIEERLKDGEKVPVPVADEYSGKFMLRIPKSLHKFLTESAKNEGVSLNQYALYKLSKWFLY